MVTMRIVLIVLLSLFLSGCGALNSFIGTSLGDYIPDWAGGLPKDAPPRPTDPRYQQYMEEQRAKVELSKPNEQSPANTSGSHNTEQPATR
jgi:hypothetical protein